jgi:RNA polymerase sigma-70 factor (ECF subfamily)
VLAVIYFIFNEGYTAHTGETLVRDEFCLEAIRLGGILAELIPDEPEVLGLLALMELQASRLRTRTDPDGNLVLLADQDRRRWDSTRIARGLACLERAGAIERAGPYQIQAALAACHARAPSWEVTDWQRIVALYRRLAEVAPSPVVELNRAAAIGMADGPEAGLAALDRLDANALATYHLLPAARADFLRRLGRWVEAAAKYREALRLAENVTERRFLAQRLKQCENARASSADSPPAG